MKIVRTALVLALLGAATVAAAGPASAGGPPPNVIVVTTPVDHPVPFASGVTFREAVLEAAADGNASVIQLPQGTYVLGTCGADDSGLLGDLDHFEALSLDIVGQGNGARIEQSCDGERLLDLGTGDVELEDLTLARQSGADPVPTSGGAVRAQGDVDFIDVTAANNRAELAGAVVFSNGGVSFTDSYIADNTGGSGVIGAASVSLDGSAVVRNVGGGIRSLGVAYIVASTVSLNDGNGTEPGGIFASSNVLLFGSTVVRNRAGVGQAANVHTDNQLFTEASILAQGAGGPECYVALDSGPTARTVTTDAEDGPCGLDDPTDIHVTNPSLGPLAIPGSDDNEASHRPFAPSAAVDAGATPGSLCGQNVMTEDQRGTARPVGSNCDAGSIEAVPPACTQTFSDVAVSSQFFDEICWMVQVGITTGFPGGTFRPSQAVTRASMSAFLYRWDGGAPFTAPAQGEETFTDVAADNTFYDEIEWMADEGISTGFNPGPEYRPSQSVTRQSMSAFLYRLMGEPAFSPPVTPSFTDVPATSTFYDEIEWMASTGVTTGFPDDTFRPGQAVTRQSMSAFLYRLANPVT